MIVLSMAVAATAGLLVFLLATQDDNRDPALSPIATTAAGLRTRAVEINGNWDEQEAALPDPDRQQLYQETERQLETLVVDTQGLVDQLGELPSTVSGADRRALEAATSDMVGAAAQMLEGLRVPGRNNKELRVTGLDLYQSAADAVLEVTGAPG